MAGATTMQPDAFVRWFRQAAPYIHAFRGRTFVIAFGGEVVADGQFATLAQDINLLGSLGVRLVLVHGARPQIETRLRARGAAPVYVRGWRVTDDVALDCVREAAGVIRMQIEAQLSMALANSPMQNAALRIISGNFVTARPAGVRDGVDLMHTGEVRRLDSAAMRRHLDAGDMVLLSPLGYSPTGETFNLALEEVATRAAIALDADKLIFLMETPGVEEDGTTLRQLTPAKARSVLTSTRLPEDVGLYLPVALEACENGVARCHLLSRHVDGALLQELFTHDGVGTMLTEHILENLRGASINDVGGILALIEPLEAEGILVRRSRELLEMEIERFHVIEHDGMIIGCAALYPFPEEGLAEMACLAIHPEYRNGGRGDLFLRYMEETALRQGVRQLFALTTRTAHWFIERGFVETSLDSLPLARRNLYNFQRRSKVMLKPLQLR